MKPRPPPSAGALIKDTFKGKIHPDWCPGCGDFSVLSALQAALFELGLKPHQVVTISGIGCSSNLPGFINTYGMHTLHGRALAVATGVKLGNHELKVICTGGDGDGFGIGGNHFMHTMRRNVDLTYIVMDNQIYGLTTGQTSPTSRKGMKTKSTPFGNVENPINPIPLAIVGGATYVARGFSGKQKHLVELFKGAHPAQGLFARGRLQPLRHLQQGQHLPILQSAREAAGGIGPRHQRISPRRWKRATNGARKFPSACSGNGRTCRRWKNWNRCWQKAGRWRTASWASATNRRSR